MYSLIEWKLPTFKLIFFAILQTKFICTNSTSSHFGHFPFWSNYFQFATRDLWILICFDELFFLCDVLNANGRWKFSFLYFSSAALHLTPLTYKINSSKACFRLTLNDGAMRNVAMAYVATRFYSIDIRLVWFLWFCFSDFFRLKLWNYYRYPLLSNSENDTTEQMETSEYLIWTKPECICCRTRFAQFWQFRVIVYQYKWIQAVKSTNRKSKLCCETTDTQSTQRIFYHSPTLRISKINSSAKLT